MFTATKEKFGMCCFAFYRYRFYFIDPLAKSLNVWHNQPYLIGGLVGTNGLLQHSPSHGPKLFVQLAKTHEKTKVQGRPNSQAKVIKNL